MRDSFKYNWWKNIVEIWQRKTKAKNKKCISMQIVIAHLFCKIMISVCADVCVTDTLTSSPAKVNITLIVYRRVAAKLPCRNLKKSDVIIVIDDTGYTFIQ